MFTSERGLPLVTQETMDEPQLTVEAYEKWYNLYILHPDGTVEPIHSSHVMAQVDKGRLWIDHNYQPKLVEDLARDMNLVLPDVVYELVVGRWVVNQLGEYVQEDPENY